jgi:hypothetical protein
MHVRRYTLRQIDDPQIAFVAIITLRTLITGAMGWASTARSCQLEHSASYKAAT